MREYDFEAYCDNCPYIDATTETEAFYADNKVYICSTKISCSKIDMCRRVEKEVAKKLSVLRPHS